MLTLEIRKVREWVFPFPVFYSQFQARCPDIETSARIVGGTRQEAFDSLCFFMKIRSIGLRGLGREEDKIILANPNKPSEWFGAEQLARHGLIEPEWCEFQQLKKRGLM